MFEDYNISNYNNDSAKKSSKTREEILEESKNDDNHSWSLNDGFTKDETVIASRCHGAFEEALNFEYTPIGMHYLLIHFDVPQINEKEYALTITGLVENPLTLTLDDIKKRRQITIPIVMECSGNGRTLMRPRFNKHRPWHLDGCSQSIWTGCLLKDLLEEAKLQPGAVDIVFTGYDKGVVDEKSIISQKELNPKLASMYNFQRSLNLMKDDVINDCILAYEMNGQPLPPQHGYPLRLIVPGWYGMASTKWLFNIDVVNYRFKGHFMREYSYTIREMDFEVALPVTNIKPRALINVPGVPHFFTRARYIEPGNHLLTGKAWVGGSTSKKEIKIVNVKISVDNGLNWNMCTITKERESLWGWYSWEFMWMNVSPGNYVIMVLATDSENKTQPINSQHEGWDYRSMANNIVHKVPVHVIDFKQIENKIDFSFNLGRLKEPK